MNKAEFTKVQLYDSIRYAIYCHFFEFDPNDTEVLKDYNKFWTSDEIAEHMGDCTNQNCPCLKCQAEWITDDASKSFDYLWKRYST